MKYYELTNALHYVGNVRRDLSNGKITTEEACKWLDCAADCIESFILDACAKDLDEFCKKYGDPIKLPF